MTLLSWVKVPEVPADLIRVRAFSNLSSASIAPAYGPQNILLKMDTHA